MKRAFVTGTAGFIGFHLAERLLREGWTVFGYDGMTDYYDVSLKRSRHSILHGHPRFSACEALLEDGDRLHEAAADFAPDVMIHLAAQAGVRYSLEAPRSYVDANVVGSFNVMDVARHCGVSHLLMASTSSVYGASPISPFVETQKTDEPRTIYAATKKATEVMAHAWAHTIGLPITMFRFFTVYGPWGRPDMALFKFTKGILEGTPIEIYNNGDMVRDFTYVADIVDGIVGLIGVVPSGEDTRVPGDSLSPDAPFRVVNIGNAQKVRLLDLVEQLENALGRKAEKVFLPMQVGDVPMTWADCSLLDQLTGTRPATALPDGIRAFIDWYRAFYGYHETE